MSLLSLFGLQPDQAPMQASSMGATSMAQGQTMQQPKGLLGLGGNLGGFLDFQDPQRLIGLQFLANGQKAPGEMLDGIPQLALYGSKLQQQKLEQQKEQQAKNATTEFLKTNDPGLANLVAQGALTPAQAYQQYAQKQQQAQEEQRWQARQEYLQNTPDAQLQRRYTTAQLDALTTKQTMDTPEIRSLKERARLAGLQEGTPEFQRFMMTDGKGPLVSVNTADNSSAFIKKADEEAAKRLGDMVTEGNRAGNVLADMQQLQDLGTQIQTGRGAQALLTLGPYAKAVGVNIEGLDAAQAYDSIIQRLAPNMRPPGSGATSDRDAIAYIKGLPNIANEPGGNEIINQTNQAVAQSKIDAAEIANRAFRNQITWQEAENQIAKLPNPYDRYKQWSAENEKRKASAAPTDGTPKGNRTKTGVQWSID